MSCSRVLLTYKRKRHARNDHLQEDGGLNSPSEANKGTCLSKPDMQVHLIDENASEDYETKTVVRLYKIGTYLACLIWIHAICQSSLSIHHFIVRSKYDKYVQEWPVS